MSVSTAPLPPAPLKSAPKPSLAGLTRAQLAEALQTAGVPEREIRMRASQLWHWIYFRGADDFDAMLNICKAYARQLAEHFSLGAAGDRRGAGLDRRHAQMADALARRKATATKAPKSNASIFPRATAARCAFRAGRLHADLQLLPYRHAEAGPQSHVAGDHRRSSSSRATGSAIFPDWSAPTDGLMPGGEGVRARLEHRLHGHGRAAL